MFRIGFNNKGVSVVEYALLAALIGTASVLGVTTLGTQTASLFERDDLRLADSNGGDNSSGGSAGSGDGLGDHRATQNLDMSLFRIVNINDPLNPSDAATKGYVDTAVASISTEGDDLGNHIATQILDMGTFRISSLGTPVDANDAANKSYVDGQISSRGPGFVMVASGSVSVSGGSRTGTGVSLVNGEHYVVAFSAAHSTPGCGYLVYEFSTDGSGNPTVVFKNNATCAGIASYRIYRVDES